MHIHSSDIAKCCALFKKQDFVWGTANAELYGLCQKYPHHNNHEQTIAKLWMIGRTYAAALERRKGVKVKTDALYTQVANRLSLQMDGLLQALAKKEQLSPESFKQALELHKHLTEWFVAEEEKGTFPVKRSLASKYLHFHLPNLFPIYDANAVFAVNKLVSNRNISDTISDVSDYEEGSRNCICDQEYRSFCLKVLALQRYLGWQDLKQIDDFLLYYADWCRQGN